MENYGIKTTNLMPLSNRFTVGRDFELDQHLLKADCVASLAHATMLEKIGILTKEELVALKEGLAAIIQAHENGDFPIARSDRGRTHRDRKCPDRKVRRRGEKDPHRPFP